MSIEVSWDNADKTIVRYTYGLQWDWYDFWRAVEKSSAMIATIDHTVHLIADFCDGTPPPVGAMGQFKKSMEESPENLGVVVVVGGGHLVNMMVRVFIQLNVRRDSQLRVAKTAEDARKLIAELS